MEVRDAIRDRRAVRDYLDEPVSEETVKALIEAATLAPSSVNSQPWAFVVVQDKDLLKRISDRSKMLMLHADFPEEISRMVASPQFSIFYNASTMILICAKPDGQHPEWDCCLAGQNLMLEARDLGFGTCVIGLALPALELPEIKKELEIPSGYEAVLPIIVGLPKAFPANHLRKPPEILSWKRPPEPLT